MNRKFFENIPINPSQQHRKDRSKFFSRLRNMGHKNTKIRLEPIADNSQEDRTEENSNLFLRQLNKILDKDIHRNALLNTCNQTSVLPFEEVFSQSSFKDLVRFDCGSYAELFSGYDNNTNELIVLKVIRAVSSDLQNKIRGPEFRAIGTFKDLNSEFLICEALSSLSSLQEFETHCFPKVFSKYLVIGDIPEYFLIDKPSDELTPMRDDPFEDFVSIPREYAVISMSYGGQPLWKAIKNRTISALQMLSVVKQVAIGLAIAEAAFEFEHRDLHISNILLKETTKHKIHFVYHFNRYYIDSEGFEATIIDTTFSRIKIDSNVYYKDLKSIMKFNDEKELSLLDQFYKSMVALTDNKWETFSPTTNINWLKYITKILLKSHILNETDDKESKQKVKELYKIFAEKKSLQELDFSSF